MRTIRKSRRQIEEENERLKQERTVLQTLVNAYMRDNAKLEDDIKVLNASLDATEADRDRWRRIAKEADRRRLEYVARTNSRNSTKG